MSEAWKLAKTDDFVGLRVRVPWGSRTATGKVDAANVLGIKDGPRGYYPVFEVWIDTDGVARYPSSPPFAHQIEVLS